MVRFWYNNIILEHFGLLTASNNICLLEWIKFVLIINIIYKFYKPLKYIKFRIILANNGIIDCLINVLVFNVVTVLFSCYNVVPAKK